MSQSSRTAVLLLLAAALVGVGTGCSGERETVTAPTSADVTSGTQPDDASVTTETSTPSETSTATSAPTPSTAPDETTDGGESSGGAGDEGEQGATDPGENASTPTADAAPSPTRDPGVPGGIPGAEELSDASEDALVAVTVAENTVGGPAAQLQPDGERWQVVVLTSAGAERRVVDPSGEVVGSESVDASSPEVLAARAVLDQDVSLGLRAAVELALAEVGGDVRSAQVELGGGLPVWVIQVADGSSATVTVDPVTGEVVAATGDGSP